MCIRDRVWEEAIVDRVKLMVERDKNRFCIVMWSMGNESAYGCNFEKALEWTKNFDPDRIHSKKLIGVASGFCVSADLDQKIHCESCWKLWM